MSNVEVIKGILSTGKQLYLNEDLADFHIICKSAEGSEESIPVHKLLLASVSDVFRAMFSDSWKEKVNVVILDAKAVEFKEFLQFFYLGQANLTMENVAGVMYLGDKYNVPECLDACTKFLRRTLTDDNICWGYSLGILYNQIDLKRFCELVIAMNTKDVFASSSFLESNKELLGHILSIDSLSCSEADLFEACMEWVKEASGESQLTREIVETHFGELIFEIRFKSMTPQQFANLIPTYGNLFSGDEYKDISQSNAMRNFEPNIFSKELRTPFENIQCDENDKIECNRSLTSELSRKPYYIKDLEKTRFFVNQPMLLNKIQCSQVCEYKMSNYYGITNLSSAMKIVQIIDVNNELVLYDGDILLKSDLTYVTLPKPILVRAGVMYEIQLKQTPPPHCCTGHVLKSEVHVDSNIKIQFDRQSVLSDDFDSGTIVALHFNRI